MSNLKFQVVRLMRMLVQICQTLDYVPPEVGRPPYLIIKPFHPPATCTPVAAAYLWCASSHHCPSPLQRYLFMKMTYHPDTPGKRSLTHAMLALGTPWQGVARTLHTPCNGP